MTAATMKTVRHGLATLGMGDPIGRHRNDDVGYGSHQTDQDAGDDHPRKPGSERGEEQRDRHRGVHAHHQGAALGHISEGHKTQDSGGIPHLGRDGDPFHGTRIAVEGLSHDQQQGLVVIDRPNAHRAGYAQEG
jgi:hypothetical protein